jgi:hypothetical protein
MGLSPKTLGVAFQMLLVLTGAAYAQSGRSVMRGWVAFDGVAYVDKQPRAKVELCARKDTNPSGYTAETDEHGFYEIRVTALGECTLRISAPGFTTYEISVYIPSDFVGNLATLLKRDGGKRDGIQKK